MLLAAITPLLVFTAFLLLLLVSLSIPIIKTIYILRLTAYVGASALDASAQAVARFGVWGYCTSSVTISIVGLADTVSAPDCSKPHLGYDFDSTVQSVLRAQNVDPNALKHALTAAFVLHPIACGITFLALLSSLYILRWRTTGISRAAAGASFGLGLLAATLATVVFIFDVVMVADTKGRVWADTDGLVAGTYGNGVWMVLGAALALWFSTVGTAVALFRTIERRKYRY